MIYLDAHASAYQILGMVNIDNILLNHTGVINNKNPDIYSYFLDIVKKKLSYQLECYLSDKKFDDAHILFQHN